MSANTNNNNNNNNAVPFLDFTGEQTELLKVQAIPSTEYALKGVKNELHILFQITTLSTVQDNQRPPCDLAIVLDRSGSMGGEKLENSKLAIKEVIQNLLPNDKLHFITYDSKIETIFENADLTNIQNLNQQVDQVVHRGMTNLYGGLERGFEVLQKNKSDEGRVQRIFLFSDGLANEGKSKHSDILAFVNEIHSSGVSVSSFGIGSDFDETLMKSIAEQGSGDYFFIDSAQAIQTFVNLALKGLLGLVGTNALLKIRGVNGSVVTKIYAHNNIVQGAKLGDLRQSNMRKIVCNVDLAPTGGEELEIVHWSLTYIPFGEKQSTELSGKLKIKLTDDDSLLLKKNSAVEIARITQETAESDLVALQLIDQGKRKEAIEMKKKEMARLRELESSDNNGFITKLIENEEKAIADMETKNEVEAKKAVHYNSYVHQTNDFYMM